VKSLVALIAVTVVVGFSTPVFAAEEASQPLTKAECDKAGMKWDDAANVCGGNEDRDYDESRGAEHKHGKDKHDRDKHGSEEMGSTGESMPQPLTRADCDKAGMKWNSAANVCGKTKGHGKDKDKKKNKHGKNKQNKHGKGKGGDSD